MDKYYNQIKENLVNNEIYKRTKDYSKNRNDLKTYYDVGKLLIEAQGGEKRAKYGNKLIKEYSKKLLMEIDKKYSERNLRNMRNFYLLFKDEIWNALRSKLSWTHYRILLSINNINEINYYIMIAEEQHLSYRELEKKIKSNEYKRLPYKTKQKLINKEDNEIQDFIKNPININSNIDYENISEKILKPLILEDIHRFLKELGDGFSFIDSEYKIKIGNQFNYIDILLYNIKYKCYVVIELKVTELKKSHIGQIQIYMNYIDKNLKGIDDNKTIGIIIVKEDNQFIMKYCSDERIFRTTFKIN